MSESGKAVLRCPWGWMLLVLLLAFPLSARAAAESVCLDGEPCPNCGNGVCDGDEEWRCPSDCTVSFCGDNACDFNEDCSSCSTDCGSCPPPIVCGNALCQFGESCSNCAADCGPCPTTVCGNSACELGESCSSCEADCGACPTCPNGICDAAETCSTCAQDCGGCGGGGGGGNQPVCGNTVCQSGESCSNCATDCGVCVPNYSTCNNDLFCNSFESCSSCPGDCCLLIIPGGGGQIGPNSGGGKWGDPCYDDYNCAGGNECAGDGRCWPLLH